MLIMLDLPFLRHHVVDWMNGDDEAGTPETKPSQDKKPKNL